MGAAYSFHTATQLPDSNDCLSIGVTYTRIGATRPVAGCKRPGLAAGSPAARGARRPSGPARRLYAEAMRVERHGRVMLLIPSESYRAPDFMAAAANLGIEVVVGSDQASPLEHLSEGRHAAFAFGDPETGAGQVETFADQFPLDRIMAVDDAGARLAAHAARRLEIPHNPVSAVEATRNKAMLRERLARSGVPSPPWLVAPIDADPPTIARTVQFPVVLKPLSLSASRGVIRANTPGEFVDAFDRIRRILGEPDAREECGDLSDRILIEGYVPGIEVSLEGLLSEGKLHVLALFDKPDPLEGPFFEETIYVTPSRLPPDQQQEIVGTTERALAAIGLRDGPVHAELRLNDEGVHPIDIAARSIGGLCSRTLTFGTGMSLEELLLRHATGMDIPTLEREQQASGVMMLPIPGSGTLESVHGIGHAEAVDGIQSVTLTIPIGKHVTALPEGNEYLGFMFARGDTPEAVERALREAHDRLRFDIHADE
jgi:biotin carboxylase